MAVADSVERRTREEHVERARALAPLLRELAPRAESERHLPRELLDAFVDAGLVRTLVPHRHGGYELDFTAHLDVSIELGRAYGSLAWVGSVLADDAWFLAHFDDAAQRDVWGGSNGPDTCVGASLVPVGTVEPVKGGYLLSGEWGWASGVAFCEWVVLGGLVFPAGGGGAPAYRLFLAPARELEIRDTWYAAGLRGSGSDSVRADRVLVPEHRTLAMELVRDGGSPGSAVNPARVYQVPLMAQGGYAMLGPALGIARGVIDAWREHVASKAHSYTHEQVTAAIPMQLAIAEASGLVDAAELMVRRVLSVAESGADLSIEHRVTARRDLTLAMRLIVQSVDGLMQVAGASALRDESPIQRGWRDVHAISCHVFMNANAAGENFGRLAFGLPLNPRDPFF